MKKILIIDDEKEIRELLKERLKKNKYEAFAAAGGEEGYALARIKKPDLILLDIAMPAMDGYQTCKKLKEDIVTEHIPIIFLTGKDLDPQGIIARAKSLGASGYLPKPSTFKELLDKIANTIG